MLSEEDDECLVLISTEEGIGHQSHEVYFGVTLGNKKAILISRNENQDSSIFE